MSLNVEDYINRPRGTKWERELARQLRQMPEGEAFAFIEELLLHRLVLGLEMAKSCLRSPSRAQKLFERGLAIADASEIQFWIGALLPKLGFRRSLSILEHELERNPRAVGRAVYWMAKSIPEGRPDLADAFWKLTDRARAKGAIPETKMRPDPSRPGRVLFDPIDDW